MFKFIKKQGLLFFLNPFFPGKKYAFMNICGIMWVKDKKKLEQPIPEWKIWHEKTHTAQILECLIFGFYIIYILNFLYNLVKYKNWDEAYENILFEREAYAAEYKSSYNRKIFTYKWLKCKKPEQK